MLTFTFKCPSCAKNLPPVEAMQAATQITKRTCRHCGDRWLVKVEPPVVRDNMRMDKGTFTFLDNRHTRKGGK